MPAHVTIGNRVRRYRLVALLALLVAPLLGLRTGTVAQSQAPVEATLGAWAMVASWPAVVAGHTHLLPNGSVLMWNRGRTADDKHIVGAQDFWVWNRLTGEVTQGRNETTNLFCSGHAFLPDGRLLVAGGTIGGTRGGIDEPGPPDANVYNYRTNRWEALPDMNAGRWYPTVTALAGGGMLVSSGLNETEAVNQIPQIWRSGAWRNLAARALPLYPWTFQVPRNGEVFYAGPDQPSAFLNPTTGAWRAGPAAAVAARTYGTAVMFDGTVLIVGGGTPVSTASAERIDLKASTPTWAPAGAMAWPRIHHNATLLPDGTVLVTGGQREGTFSAPLDEVGVREAERYDPRTGQWTTLAAMQRPRAYHSTALLLPDGRVLVAGGGAPARVNEPNAEFFSPPYLFKGPRPRITAAPGALAYGQSFLVETPQAAEIGAVRLIRLGSVTHSFNQNQRLVTLRFSSSTTGVTATAPARSAAPPGHYLLFIITREGVPSVAKIVTIG